MSNLTKSLQTQIKNCAHFHNFVMLFLKVMVNILFTECAYNHYGLSCSPCSEHCHSLPCDADTGGCVDGMCAPGYLGFNCTQGRSQA